VVHAPKSARAVEDDQEDLYKAVTWSGEPVADRRFKVTGGCKKLKKAEKMTSISLGRKLDYKSIILVIRISQYYDTHEDPQINQGCKACIGLLL
jgi:hypothetical protein